MAPDELVVVMEHGRSFIWELLASVPHEAPLPSYVIVVSASGDTVGATVGGRDVAAPKSYFLTSAIVPVALYLVSTREADDELPG